MFIAQIKALMTKVLDDEVNKTLLTKCGIGKRAKRIRKNGLTLEGLAKDILDDKNS